MYSCALCARVSFLPAWSHENFLLTEQVKTTLETLPRAVTLNERTINYPPATSDRIFHAHRLERRQTRSTTHPSPPGNTIVQGSTRLSTRLLQLQGVQSFMNVRRASLRLLQMQCFPPFMRVRPFPLRLLEMQGLHTFMAYCAPGVDRVSVFSCYQI